MAVKEKGLLSANYCVASNSNMTNCCNQTCRPGINMHYFSEDKLYRRSGYGLSEIKGKISSLSKSGLGVVRTFTIWLFWYGGVGSQLKNEFPNSITVGMSRWLSFLSSGWEKKTKVEFHLLQRRLIHICHSLTAASNDFPHMDSLRTLASLF